LHDKKIGIRGAGNIGSAVIQIARVFTNKIYCHTKHPDKHTVLKNANVIFTNINRLFSETDVIIVTVPLTNETKGMINNDQISLMKKDSIFVSISRTPVIDIDNLCTAVEKGTILGAAIDGEFPEHIYTRYKETPNLLLTTHIAGNSIDANAKADTLMGGKIIQHITHLQF
ncbi:hypothetical protein KC573_02070, partial [candidate division WWE3 bacterium]|nr:hypothetical protein [candidate division WWE3 bacterium]